MNSAPLQRLGRLADSEPFAQAHHPGADRLAASDGGLGHSVGAEDSTWQVQCSNIALAKHQEVADRIMSDANPFFHGHGNLM